MSAFPYNYVALETAKKVIKTFTRNCSCGLLEKVLSARMWLKDLRELYLSSSQVSCTPRRTDLKLKKDRKPFLLSYHCISIFLVGILNHSSVCIVAEESHAFSNLHICQTPQGRMENFKYSSLYLNLNNAKKICSSFILVTKIYNTWIIRSNCCAETVPVDISETRMYITSAQIGSFLQIWIIYIPIITMASDYLNF